MNEVYVDLQNKDYLGSNNRKEYTDFLLNKTMYES